MVGDDGCPIANDAHSVLVANSGRAREVAFCVRTAVRKPILNAAIRVGIDSLALLSSLQSTSIASALARSTAVADSVGVWNLPVLIGADIAWVGTQAARRLSKR